MLSWLNVFECSGSSHIHILSRVKLVVYPISGYTSDLLTVNILMLPQEQIKLSQRFISVIFAPFFGLKIDFNFRFWTFMLQIS